MPRPRPTDTSDDVVRAAVREDLWPDVCAWLIDGGWDESDDTDEVERCIDELVEAVRYEHDGYRRAKSLDDWNPDTDLVEILSGFSVYKARQKAVAEWVAETNPKPPCGEGDLVSFSTSIFDKPEQGIVAKSDPYTATFVVRVKKPNSTVNYSGIAWEKCTPIAQTQESPK